jgi:hypothetical protein
MPKDWWDWHRPYDEPGSPLAERLRVVQNLVRDALDTAAPGPVRAISICAGQGRDLLDVLVCGVFGNVTDTDVHRTITLLPRLCALGATVIWTRHRKAPDLTPRIRAWFAAAGFEELAFVAPDDRFFSVGAQRLVVQPPALGPTADLFTFVGYDALLNR